VLVDPLLEFCACDADVAVGELDGAGGSAGLAPVVEGGAADFEECADFGDGEVFGWVVGHGVGFLSGVGGGGDA
jgi:hypothetical protein